MAIDVPAGSPLDDDAHRPRRRPLSTATMAIALAALMCLVTVSVLGATLSRSSSGMLRGSKMLEQIVEQQIGARPEASGDH